MATRPLRPIDDSPNARPVSNDWADPALRAYAASADYAHDNAMLQSRFMIDQVGQLENTIEKFALQDMEFKQRKALEDQRAQNEIWQERQLYDYKTQKELDRLRAGMQEVDSQPWPENVKAQVKGQLQAQMMGLRNDRNNYVPKPPSIKDQIESQDIYFDKDNGVYIYRDDESGAPKFHNVPRSSMGNEAQDEKTRRTMFESARKRLVNDENDRALESGRTARQISQTQVLQEIIRTERAAGNDTSHWEQQLDQSKREESAGALVVGQSITGQPGSDPMNGLSPDQMAQPVPQPGAKMRPVPGQAGPTGFPIEALTGQEIPHSDEPKFRDGDARYIVQYIREKTAKGIPLTEADKTAIRWANDVLNRK